MPTTNPRINVTLSPSTDSLVGLMAASQGISKSQVIREILEAAEPTFQKALAIMAAAKKVREGSRKEIADSLERSLVLATQGLEHDLHLIAKGTGDLVRQAEEVKGRKGGRARRARPSAASTPLSSNRGVNSTKKGKKGVLQ